MRQIQESLKSYKHGNSNIFIILFNINAMSRVKVLFGTASFGSQPTEMSQDFLDVLKKHKVKDLDTARTYEGSERALKELGATSSFTIHTKAPGFVKNSGTKASILAAAKQSFEDLGVKSVETYFVHSPDPGTPIEQTVDGMQLVYASGKYKHVGQTCVVHCTRMSSSEAYVEAYVVDSLVSRTLSRRMWVGYTNMPSRKDTSCQRSSRGLTTPSLANTIRLSSHSFETSISPFMRVPLSLVDSS